LKESLKEEGKSERGFPVQALAVAPQLSGFNTEAQRHRVGFKRLKKRERVKEN